jgi:pyruvate dehydrogenase E1 component alpha subunit
MRRFEEDVGKAYSQGKFAGFCHLYIGQEAVALGATAAMTPQDYMISGYREHAQAISRGMSPESVMAELFGKSDGCSRGKGGSMHLFSKEHRFLGGDGIVGGQIPVATGVGWALKYRQEPNVCVCLFGDAAINQGAFHESVNMARIWNLPVIYVVENNLYGMGTAISRSSSTPTLAERGAGFAMPSERINAQSFFQMYNAMWRARQRAVEDGLFILLEVVCYCYKGHSVSDPQRYRSRAEVDWARTHDPIKMMATTLQSRGILSASDVKNIDKKVKAQMVKVMEFADNSPPPPWEWALQDVLAEDGPTEGNHA